MWIPTAVSYVFSLLISIWGTQFYVNLFKSPIYFSIPVVLAVVIPISIVFLVPLDYVQHNSDNDLLWFSLPNNVILYLWKSNYWTTFLLTWLMLPLLQEFFRSGQYKPYNRLIDAMKTNLRFQLVVLAVLIMAFIYLLLEVGLSFGHIKSMIIALSHIYALVLALWLMAHGLINIPRNKWNFGTIIGNLNHYYLQVPKLVDELEDCKIAFKEDILKVLVLEKNFTRDLDDAFIYRDWILKLYNKIPEDLKELMELQFLNDAPVINRNQLTNHYMTKLSGTFNANLHKLVAYESAFLKVFNEIILYEDLSNLTAGNPQFRIENVKSFLSPKARYIFYAHVNPVLNRIISIVLFVAAFIIIESELFHSTRLSLINLIFTRINHNLLQFITCCVVFCLMLVCALNSLTKLKVFNMYHLVPHHSDKVSVCFYAMYIARLTIPLSYNFVTLFVSRKSIFEDWFGKSIHLTGLFNLMNNWIPRLILIPIILTLFNVYDKLKRRLGLSSDLYDSFGFDDIETQDEFAGNKRKDMIIVEAKRIIGREFTKRQLARNLRPFNLRELAGNAADMNYEANRRTFEDSLVNRIDFNEFHDDPQQPRETLWNRIGNQFTSFRDSFSLRFSGGGSRSRVSQGAYTDEPISQIEDFDYDDDANNTMVL